MRHLLSFVLRMLKDQRGEVDLEAPEIEEENIDDEIIEINPDELEEEEDDEAEKLAEAEKAAEKAAEKEETENLKAELAKRDTEVKKMNKSFYGMRKKMEAMEKKSDGKETGLSKDQMLEMIEEHREDPDALFKVIEQVSRQVASGEAENKVEAAEISQRKKDMDDYLISTWADANEEGSENYENIQKSKEFLHVEDHPLGDFLGAAGMVFLQMPGMLESARKDAREGALTVEDNRKKSIKENSLESGKKKEAPEKPSSNQLSVAKQLNLSKSATAVYLKLLKKNNTTVEV